MSNLIDNLINMTPGQLLVEYWWFYLFIVMSLAATELCDKIKRK